MTNIIKCNTCKGKGSYEALISQHDNKTEIVKCKECNGKGTVYIMTEEEENNYWENYW